MYIIHLLLYSEHVLFYYIFIKHDAMFKQHSIVRLFN